MIHQWKGLYEYYNKEIEKFDFFSKKFEIDEIEFCPYPECPYPEERNPPGFVDISPTLVIDTSRAHYLHKYYNMEIQFFLFF